MLVPATVASSQRCGEAVNLPELQAILGGDDERLVAWDQLYRACAIGGEALRTTLRELEGNAARPAGVRAEAAACLARLGEDSALAPVIRGLETTRLPTLYIAALARANTRASTAALINYMSDKQDDPSRIVDFGDASEDPIYDGLRALERQFPDGPTSQPVRQPLASVIREWQTWLASDAAHGRAPRIESRVANNPYDRCLARLAEWGFPDALLGLNARDTSGSLANLFRELAHTDLESFEQPYLPGEEARTILAQRGDEREFRRIVATLRTSQYIGALAALEYIGGLNSVGAVIASLDLNGFMPGMTGAQRDEEGRRYRAYAFGTLSKMVKHPPVPETADANSENVARWQTWWAAGPAESVLAPPRRPVP